MTCPAGNYGNDLTAVYSVFTTPSRTNSSVT